MASDGSKHLRMLMRREVRLAERIASVRALGGDPRYLAAEVRALHWAIEELSRAYPEPAARARQDVVRAEERRAIERRGRS